MRRLVLPRLRQPLPDRPLDTVEALREARKQDTGTANPLLRARWEMYRPFFGAASFYPPNGFLDAPMADSDEAIRLNPNDPNAFTGRAAVYQAKGQAAKAEADWGEAERLKRK